MVDLFQAISFQFASGLFLQEVLPALTVYTL